MIYNFLKPIKLHFLTANQKMVVLTAQEGYLNLKKIKVLS